MYKWTDGAELYHFGIRGMKWGIRRFQNEDGTLTEEGVNRYRKRLNQIDKYSRKEERARRKAGPEIKNKAAYLRAKSDRFARKAERLAARYSAKAARYANKASKVEYSVAKAQMMADRYAAKGAKAAAKMAREFAGVSVEELKRAIDNAA